MCDRMCGLEMGVLTKRQMAKLEVLKFLSFVERTNVEASKCQAQKPAGDAIVNLSIACSLLN